MRLAHRLTSTIAAVAIVVGLLAVTTLTLRLQAVEPPQVWNLNQLRDADGIAHARIGAEGSTQLWFDSVPADGSTADAVVQIPAGSVAATVDQLIGSGATVEMDPADTRDSLLRQWGPLAALLLLAGVAVPAVRAVSARRRAHASSQLSDAQVPETTFADVAALDPVVAELRRSVAWLTEPDRYAKVGARPARGLLLEGPPGNGKTLLARALAGEAGVAFFSASGSDFVDTYVGVGAQRVRRLFASARDAGHAIVFIDEIDSVGRERSAGAGGEGSREWDSTLNQLLTELDGFVERDQIIVVAATNRADLLDQALTRPGRFDRTVAVPNPDLPARHQILALHCRGRDIGGTDLAQLARRTPGLSGAQLARLVNDAAVAAADVGDVTVGPRHFEAALQQLQLGAARTTPMTGRDRQIVAYHEAGHAICALLEPAHADPVQVTIVPRGPAGGATWMDGTDDEMVTVSQAHARLCVALGGRAAEQLSRGGDVTSGASGDLQVATDLATQMVTSFGMVPGRLAVQTPAAGGRLTADVAAQVEELLGDANDRAVALLTDHRPLLDEVARRLLDVETVDVAGLRDAAKQVGIALTDPALV